MGKGRGEGKEEDRSDSQNTLARLLKAASSSPRSAGASPRTGVPS